jgi:hypothetical protein
MISVEDGALQSRKTGAEAEPLRISWIAVSAVEQEKKSTAHRKKKKTFSFIMTSYPYYGIGMEGASFCGILFHSFMPYFTHDAA